MSRPSGGTSDLAAAEIQVLNGAELEHASDGTLDIRTPAAMWSYALIIELAGAGGDATDAVGVWAAVDIEVLTASGGLFLTDATAERPLSAETVLDSTGGRRTVRLLAGSPAATHLCVRTGVAGPARLRISGLRSCLRRRFDVTGVLESAMPALLRSANAEGLDIIAGLLSRELGRPVTTEEIGALECTRRPIPVPYATTWSDTLGQVITKATADLVALLPTYDSSKMDARTGFLGPEYFEKFLRQSTIRVYQLVDQLREFGLARGSVLEIGSLCGQFVLPLQRLGFDTTAVDRYRAYDGAYAGYTDYLRRAGVTVVETDRTDERAVTGALGQYDAVIAMAVIEHIPHTPRDFVQSLASHVRPGGLLVLDTPNIARYWNRRRLAEGGSIHPPIEHQFYAPEPFEGHHREYTRDEMMWILAQVDCQDVRSRLFDYNPFQFDELWTEHIEALLARLVDPTLADTILVAGRVVDAASSSR
jgi:2-polyprenyl-3-methyl-5-hydroxy-6-metoxy-1,4-benzoquinol methylase